MKILSHFFLLIRCDGLPEKKIKECKASRGQKMVDISQLDGLEILYPENTSYKTL